MTIVPYACAEFHDAAGAVLYRIRPHQLRTIICDAPESIRQDPLFDMMLRDGSLHVPDTKSELKQLENDPGMKAPEAVDNGSAALGEPLTTAGGGSLVEGEVSRNKRAPQRGVAPIEAADEKTSHSKSAEKKS